MRRATPALQIRYHFISIDAMEAQQPLRLHVAASIVPPATGRLGRRKHLFYGSGPRALGVRQTRGISDLSEILRADPKSTDSGLASPALLAVIDLLVLGNAVAADRFRASCGEATFAAFTSTTMPRRWDGRRLP